MADPLGIVGVLGVAAQFSALAVEFGLDWKDAPAEAKNFTNQLEALKTVLLEMNNSILLNPAFISAFDGDSSALLTQLGGPQMTETKMMTMTWLRDTEGSTVSIFATSRHLPEVTNWFQGDACAALEIRATADDVRRYLEKHMDEMGGFVKRHSKLQEEIKTAIVAAVDGMFLLAQLHLGSLRDRKTPKALREALDALPSGSEAYDQAYDDAMKRVEKPWGMAVLGWIVHACRPLQTEELRHALGVEVGGRAFDRDSLPDVEDMVSACAGLVTVDEESGVIRLVHYTTQQYFERTKSHWFPAMEDRIADACVTYLRLGDFDDGACKFKYVLTERLRTYGLYGYASQYWGYHARQAPELSQPVLDLLGSEPHASGAGQAMWAHDKRYERHHPSSPTMRGIHLAAHFGVTGAVRALLDKGCAPDCQDPTPLWWAAESGQVETARLLLAIEGVDPDEEGFLGRTPLAEASSQGHTDMVELLLEKGADINRDSNDWMGEKPLMQAIRGVQQRTAELLLKRGADPNRMGVHGDVPISAAATWNMVGMVKLLVDGYGVDPNAAYGGGHYLPLHAAARRGSQESVQFLVQRGADPNTKCGWRDRTPLAVAAAAGHENTVRWLLQLDDVDADVRDSHGMTPLLLAARCGFPHIADLIASRVHLTPEHRAAWDHMRLLAASEQGDVAAVGQLLARGLCPNQEDCDTGQTPLHLAASEGHDEVARLLLADGRVELNQPDTFGHTPLSYAARRRRTAMVEMLIGTGRVDCNATGPHLPLLAAAENGSTEMLDMLLAKGNADPNQKDEGGMTALSIAAMQGLESAARRLLQDDRLEVDARDKNGITPLSWAVKWHQERIVQILVEAKAEVDARDNGGRTPLSRAIENGNENIIKLLHAVKASKS